MTEFLASGQQIAELLSIPVQTKEVRTDLNEKPNLIIFENPNSQNRPLEWTRLVVHESPRKVDDNLLDRSFSFLGKETFFDLEREKVAKKKFTIRVARICICNLERSSSPPNFSLPLSYLSAHVPFSFSLD